MTWPSQEGTMKNPAIKNKARKGAARRPAKATRYKGPQRGLVPAFLDSTTGTIYLSRRADGSLAMIHLIEGLPDELIAKRNEAGKPMGIKPSIIAGFVSEGKFYTRDEAGGGLYVDDDDGELDSKTGT